MKCNSDNFINFFKSDNFDKETKDFVMDIFSLYSEENKFSYDFGLKTIFLDIGLFEISDESVERFIYMNNVIDFSQLLKFEGEFRTLLFKMLKNIICNYSKRNNNDITFIKDLKILISYSEWNKLSRKRKKKLETLNNVKQ